MMNVEMALWKVYTSEYDLLKMECKEISGDNTLDLELDISVGMAYRKSL